MKSKLVDTLSNVEPFWIARFGDWLYLFDYPSGRLLGKPLFCPMSSTPHRQVDKETKHEE